MKEYEKPVMILNDETGEGVYAASGVGIDGSEESDCWTVDPVSVQDWDGSAHVFEIRCVHSNAVQHISSASTVVLTFDCIGGLSGARSEFSCTYSGNTVTIVRELHANAYQSGDSMTYKVWVWGADEAATKAISCIGSSISCTKTVNVQGGGADGN